VTPARTGAQDGPAAGPGPEPATVRIGITGPIGCGKSTVARWLAQMGTAVVDADRLAREVTAPGEPALAAIAARFGERFIAPDGRLDRAALGRLVFADPAALRDLEAIVHPAVRPRIEAAVAAAEAAGAPIIVIEAIKLVEAGYATACDEVWLVVCDPTEQRRRLVERGDEPGAVDARIRAQADLAERLEPAATRVLDTSGDPDSVRRMVRALRDAALARGPRRDRGGEAASG
jgi:dephospho-CoA kinase